MQPQRFPLVKEYLLILKKMCLFDYGNASNFQYQMMGYMENKVREWVFVKVTKIDKDQKTDHEGEVTSCSATPLEFSLMDFLRERKVLEVGCWVAFNKHDTHFIMRNDRIIYESEYPNLFDKGRYTFMTMSPLDRLLIPEKGKERLLVVNDLEKGTLNIHTNLYYWEEHHRKESGVYMCEK